MKVALCYSMQFAEKAHEAKLWFSNHGHEAYASNLNEKYLGLSDEGKENLKLEHKYNHNAIGEHWKVIQDCDVILVLNYSKNGIENYIGGNTFLEMGFAHVLEKPIFMLNPTPEIEFYKTEIIAMKPIIINGDLSKIVKRHLS